MRPPDFCVHQIVLLEVVVVVVELVVVVAVVAVVAVVVSAIWRRPAVQWPQSFNNSGRAGLIPSDSGRSAGQEGD